MDPFRAVVSAASVENSETKETATTESVELEAVNLSPLRDDGLTLIEIAKTPNCSADAFLARARARPDEIGLTDERFEEIYGHIPESPVETAAALVMEDLDAIHRSSATMPPKKGAIGGCKYITAMHYFIKNCRNVRGSHITELLALDKGCLEVTTSKKRSAVHWLMAFNLNITPSILAAVYRNVSEGAFTVLDIEG